MLTYINVIKAITCAVIINCVLFWTGKHMGIISDDILLPNIEQPLKIGTIISASIFPILVAAALLYLISKWVARPKLIFNSLAIVVLLLSFFTPFSIPNVSLGMAMLLNVMHVVAAFSAMYFFESLTGFRKIPEKPQL